MTAATLWAEFRSESLPENAPPYQVRAMKMAFMAGMSAAINEITRLPDGTTEPKIRTVGLRIFTHNLNALAAELRAWAMEAKFRV